MQHCCGHRRELPRSPRPQPLPPSGKDLGPSCGECDLCRQPPPPKSQPCGAGRPAVPERGGVMKAPAQPGANSSDRQLGQTELDCPERLDFVFFQFWSLLHKEPPNRSLRTFCSSDGPSLGPSMSMQYEKFQHLESEKQSQRSRNDSKFRRDLATLRATFSNFTANTVAEVQALKSQGGHLQEVITSLKAEVENHKQGLQAARSLNDKVFSLESKLEQEQKELKAGHSDALLRVQQLARDLRSLTCQMAALKSNGSQNTCCPPNWLEYGGSCYWFSGSGKTWEDADRLLCRAISAHTPGWASVTLKESGNGWTGRTMRPTSSECALAFCALLRPCTLAPPGSGPQPLVPGPPGCPLSVPAGCGPLPAGTGSQASRTTGTGTGWAGARTARTSTPTASGTTMPARGPTAGCARPAWARPASAAAGASHRTAQPPAGGEREGAFP
uniref:uncharacterized protein LOC118519057 isoform X10 n=1 Tax=Halichoerus grypus TaxID=9711 RepID=UPI001659087F|nr:uncharacterized protein LOC118519057 isoform X10 [Halichoerus grypus]